mmetsp:Transcript_16481/g.26108  ORF Transcript_16481/g.26108 Transcript_16481/m.26108 type:complete len:241 (-) Transcript_16481:945-1667(-)
MKYNKKTNTLHPQMLTTYLFVNGSRLRYWVCLQPFRKLRIHQFCFHILDLLRQHSVLIRNVLLIRLTLHKHTRQDSLDIAWKESNHSTIPIQIQFHFIFSKRMEAEREHPAQRIGGGSNICSCLLIICVVGHFISNHALCIIANIGQNTRCRGADEPFLHKIIATWYIPRIFTGWRLIHINVVLLLCGLFGVPSIDKRDHPFVLEVVATISIHQFDPMVSGKFLKQDAKFPFVDTVRWKH